MLNDSMKDGNEWSESLVKVKIENTVYGDKI